MALFGRKTEEKKVEKPVAIAASTLVVSGGKNSETLRNPRITEKATSHTEEGVYTFDVSTAATKRSVIQAVRELYKVHPKKIRIVSIPTKARRNMRTGMRGSSGGGKKAYVYLRKGDTINIF